MANNANDNTFYLTFKDMHPCLPLMACSLPLGIVATIGMALNFGVIYVTFRSGALKNTANYLLALCSFFELLHQSGHYIFVFTAWTGLNFIEFQLAAKFGALSMFGLGGIAVSMFFTGLDRLICVTAPAFTQNLKLVPYLCTIVLICVLPCGYQVYLLFKTSALYPKALITGAIVDILSGPSIAFFANSNMIVNASTTLIYLITGIVIYARNGFFF